MQTYSVVHLDMYTKCIQMIMHHWYNVSPHFLCSKFYSCHCFLLMEIIKKNVKV